MGYYKNGEMITYCDNCGRRLAIGRKNGLCKSCFYKDDKLESDNPSKNMAFPKGDCSKCGRVAMQVQWYTGKKYCPICDSEKV